MTPLNDLPWQHVLLLVDAVVSALWGMVYLARGRFAPAIATNVLFILWDASLIVLLVWGADHVSWQYVVLGLTYSFATISGWWRLLTRRVTELKSTGGAVFTLWLLASAQIFLILLG